MGTDAGTDTSEKAPIGGRTSLTQPDTWLEAMDGETLCLTGKVTDCWQPVDGAQENASFYLKDLSIEADASSFVFSGDSAETTDNLSQISGSADADQMSVLISSQKTISQINEMQEIFGKNASALCYLQEDEALPRAGSYVRVFGEVSPFLQATNPGEFDAAAYYRRKDCLFALRKTKITAQTKTYGRLEEFLSQLRYESEVLFRKLLGEKNGGIASAMVLGQKKGMDSEVKALISGRRNQPPAGDFRTAPVPDGGRTVWTFEKSTASGCFERRNFRLASDRIRADDRNGHFYPARPCPVFAVFGGGTAKAHDRSANLPCGCGTASSCT